MAVQDIQAVGEAIRDAAGGPVQLKMITPGPEHMALMLAMENWLADNMINLIQKGVDESTQ